MLHDGSRRRKVIKRERAKERMIMMGAVKGAFETEHSLLPFQSF